MVGKRISWKQLTFLAIGIIVIGTLAYVQYLSRTAPGRTIVDGQTVIRNCDPPRSENAAIACPMLYCKQAIRESGEVPIDADITITNSLHNLQKGTHVQAGVIRYVGERSDKLVQHFRCVMKGNEVIRTNIVEIKEWLDMLKSGTWQKIE